MCRLLLPHRQCASGVRGWRRLPLGHCRCLRWPAHVSRHCPQAEDRLSLSSSLPRSPHSLCITRALASTELIGSGVASCACLGIVSPSIGWNCRAISTGWNCRAISTAGTVSPSLQAGIVSPSTGWNCRAICIFPVPNSGSGHGDKEEGEELRVSQPWL